MTSMMIEQEVIAVLQKMGVAEKAITKKANFSRDLGLDSLDFAEMIMEFEVKFNINIPIVDTENICTVRNVIDYLKKVL